MKIKDRLTKMFGRKKKPRHNRERIWKTKDGYKIRIKDLDDYHLTNIIGFLERVKDRQDNAIACFAGMMNGEMASYHAERAADFAADESVEERFPIYTDLHAEAVYRGLIQGVSR